MPDQPRPQEHARAHPQLPPGFRFGTASSSGEVADLVDEDVTLLKRLGVGDHNVCVSWSRIQPTGSGPAVTSALDAYDRLVDALLAHDVRPTVTLHRGDLPRGLEDDGGWLNRATIARFADYAALVADRLADRVAHWVPVHEPNVVALTGEGLPVAHHLLVGHGRAVVALRAAGATSVGCATNHAPMWPASELPEDVGATKLFDALWNGMFLEPMLLGRYPVDLAPLLEEDVREGDLATIRQPLDFYGVNYHHPMRVAAAGEDAPMPFELRELVGYPTTDDGRPVVPDALREWLIMLRARFRAALPPVVITETGCSFAGGPDEHGVVDDQPRIDYLEAHLRAVATACERGVDVRGFHAWTLLDEEEPRGLVHVDAATHARTPKRSFQWYADTIAAQPRSIG